VVLVLGFAMVLGACGTDTASDAAAGGSSVRKDADVGVEITYTRSGGRGAPPESESITVRADGTFEARRSVNVPAAGRFAGRLDGEVAARLSAAATAVDGAAAPNATLMPGAPRESIRVGDGSAVDVSRASGSPWSDLRSALIDALDAAVDHPADAVALVVSLDPLAARLKTTGEASLGGDAAALAVLWSSAWEEKGRAEVTLPAAGGAVAFDAALAPAAGDRLQVTATLTARIAGREAPVHLVAEAVAGA